MATPTERVRAVDRSSIRVMFDLAEATDRDLVRLEVGEPDFDTPEHVVDAAAEAARAGETHYTSNAGLPEVREAISGTMADRFDVEVAADEVVVTNGGMEALLLAVLSTVGPGEELLIPSPSWPNYWAQAKLADGVPVEVPMPADEGYSLDVARVTDALNENTAAVVLCSPSNPTGRMYDESAIREVVAAAAEYDAYVIADEVYLGLAYDRDPTGIAALTGHPDHVLTVNSCSKTYAMTGWRVGWLCGPGEIIDEVTKIHESTTSCASSVAQHAALAALTGPQEPVEAMYEAFRERRDYVVDRVDGIDGLSCPKPQGAFYAFLDIDVEGSSLDVAKELLTEYGVVLAPGDGFGDAGAGKLRLSFANSLDRLELGFDRIERALDER
ncbi:pyridoxal phosphate-dependent aminotransferase [Haloprofundus sp. MHR1]|uniref:pyridoxal phosphate-dependent aminotransferase n=1 Tax=Haloprofundus sp. MHR1 TaxID=2572921 RepID=UPI0010BF4227|nr:aminotransferase class I/II-fold pyridoxal phosphate-dependent enzyme [Haloprofundus sp. MHR1]QCJ45729.1 aminotransferase class I/II-fold pyridoxal phosphate-dependent enzyme [Haloprofundus sp. MHR1]